MRRVLRDERGFALVLALGVIMVFTISTVAVVTYSLSNQDSSKVSSARVSAGAVAEAGLNAAVSLLYNATSVTDPTDIGCAADPNNASNSDPSCSTNLTVPALGGTASFHGIYTQAPSGAGSWAITSTGSVSNPTKADATVTHRMTASVPVDLSSQGVFNASVWNYAISAGTSNSTTCDMTIANSAQFQNPLYVQGNLCLNNSAKLVRKDDPVNLSVGGKIIVTASGQVGTSGSPLDEIHVGGGCGTDVTKATTTCSPTGSPKVFGSILDTNFPNITLPTADYAGAYASAIPGPNNPCTTVSGTPPVWDNNGSLDLTTYPNGSEYPAASPVDLTPGTSYTCTRVDSSGHTVGIVWNAGTKTMTVNGQMYIDGSATATNSAVYTGSGSIYLSGAFVISNSVHFCAVSGCSSSAWNSNTTMLLIVAHGDDGSGNSVHLQNSVQYQGAFFATKQAFVDNSVHFDGPIIGHPLLIGNSVQMLPLPPVTTMPTGAPTVPNTHATIGAPVVTQP